MEIRPETTADRAAIGRLTTDAFAPKAYSSGTEAAIIDALRQSGDLTLSLVAVENGEIIGHVAFSPVTITNQTGDWYGLGPISVREDRQRQSIGRLLTETGLQMLKETGAHGCALIGDPHIYSRFGFVSDGTLGYGTLDPKYVQWVSFTGNKPSGTIDFAPAFEGS